MVPSVDGAVLTPTEGDQLGFPGRHLGSVQMTTDTALGVTKRVVVDKGASLAFCFVFFSF